MTACPVFVRFRIFWKFVLLYKLQSKTNLPNFRCPFLSGFFTFSGQSIILCTRRQAQQCRKRRKRFMEARILLIGKVAALMRVANMTIYRWLSERRAGEGSFPLPISPRKANLRWLVSDIER
jgi:predicted DNA-binding transcriptional regulator AlpA